MGKLFFSGLWCELIVKSHYYYRLKGEFSFHMTPKYWFRRHTEDSTLRPPYHTTNSPRSFPRPTPNRKTKKRLILSQTMVIDIDPHKVCRHGSTISNCLINALCPLLPAERPSGIRYSSS